MINGAWVKQWGFKNIEDIMVGELTQDGVQAARALWGPKEWRMYFFVMYNLSGIQKGIQAGHAAIEFAVTHEKLPEFQEFARKHKTFIVLSGGGSKDMWRRLNEIQEHKLKYAMFREPDLNGSLSAIAFLVSDDIYNFKEESLSEYNIMEYKTYTWLKSFKLA